MHMGSISSDRTKLYEIVVFLHAGDRASPFRGACLPVNDIRCFKHKRRPKVCKSRLRTDQHRSASKASKMQIGLQALGDRMGYEKAHAVALLKVFAPARLKG
jgi:hypothetical protein